MKKLSKKSILKYSLIVVLIALFIVLGIVLTKKDEKEGKTLDTMNQNLGLDVNYDIVVEIKGEVRHPGLYTLPHDTRVQDLISLAGGFTVDADTTTINLASKLTDGMVLVIPKKNSGVVNDVGSKININTATINELCTLNGIGEAIAQKIIDYRLNHGYFKSIEEIKNVSGIGDALFNKIKDDITV